MNLKLVGNPRLLAEVTNHPEIIHLKLINPTKVKFQTRSTRRDSCRGGEVLVNVSVSPKRHHDHRNFYKWKHLIGVATLQFQRFGPLSSWRSPWWLGTGHNAGRHGAGKEGSWELYILQPTKSEMSVTLRETGAKGTSTSTPAVTHFLQWGPTCFNNTIPPNSTTSLGAISFQITTGAQKQKCDLIGKFSSMTL